MFNIDNIFRYLVMKFYRFEEKPKKNLQIGKLLCLARTYKKHAKEMKTDVTKKPLIFLKPSSSVIFDKESVIIPNISTKVHHEVELGVIIGKKGKNIKKNNALDYVLGYCVSLDITARDIQSKAKKNGWPWTIAKGFDTFAPISNVILKEKITNPNNLDIFLKVNSKVRQKSNTSFMIYSIEEIIEYISKIMTLEPGDLILTGTPEGVNKIKKGDALKAGLGNFCSLEVKVE